MGLEISEIDIDFERQLDAAIAKKSFRQFIEFVSPKYEFNWHHLQIIDALQRLAERKYQRLIVMVPPRHGKALEISTPIPTPIGWKAIGDLVPGDVVFDENGMPCNVVAKSEVWKNRAVYKVKTDSGDEIIADGQHEWPVRLCRKYKKFGNKTTEFLYNRTSPRNPLLLRGESLKLAEKDLPIDPYFLGIWLGDGNSRCARITCSDIDFAEIKPELIRRGMRVSETRDGISVGVLGVQKKMKEIGLMPTKFIPREYFRASEQQRRDLLKGLIDSDGYVAKDGQVEFCSTLRHLAEGVKELVNSLGLKASLIFGRCTLNGVDHGEKYRVMFYGKDVAFLSRKNKKTIDSIRGHHYLTFEKAGKADTVCIQVDSKSHLFLAGKGMIPTHNSELVSVLFPAWCFARNSSEHVILASYAFGLASRMNRECQRIISGDAFRELFPQITFAKDTEPGAIRTNERFDIVGGGHYVSAGVGGGITGVGATIAIIDDPVKDAMEADSTTYRDRAWEWYTTTFTTRFERDAIEVICQTRWHEDDLTGRILERKKHGTEVICLPAICEGPEQNRSIGEALWPEWYSREWLLEKQSENGSRAWNALYQQRPAPDEGSIIKRQWFGYYETREYKIEGKRVNFYFDTAYTEEEKNDPTGGIAYIKEGANFYVLEFFVDWMDFSAQTVFVQDFCKRNGYSYSSIARVEPKATGKTVVQVMKKSTGLNITEGKPPKGDKVSRAHSCQGVLEGGRVLLPKGMAWVDRFLSQLAAFPNAAHDEEVDCLTGMIISENTSTIRVTSTAR